jgi:hypothetical protein
VAGIELGHAFERVSQRIIAEQLCKLDSGLGLSVSQLIIEKFKLLDQTEAASPEGFGDATEWAASERRLLSMAAHAAVQGGEVIDVEEFLTTDTNDHIELEGEGSLGNNVNSGSPSTEQTV